MSFEYYTLVDEKLVKIEQEKLKTLNDEDIIVVSLSSYTLNNDVSELKRIIPGRIISARHEKLQNLTPTSFTVPFAITKSDLDIELFTGKKYETMSYRYYDFAYQVSKKRLIAITASRWTCSGVVPEEKHTYKDMRNFARNWHEPVVLGQDGLASYPQEDIQIDLAMITKGDIEPVMEKISLYEPYFRNVVIVVDNKESSDKLKEAIAEYITQTIDEDGIDISNKIRVYHHQLNANFGEQRNFATSKCHSEWVLHLDDDEYLSKIMQKTLLRTAAMALTQKKVGVLFPRKNFLNDVLVNDIPREKWTKEYLDKVEIDREQRIEKNFDFQGRLHKRFVKWVRSVHEMIEPLYFGLKGNTKEANKLLIAQESYILHPKTLDKQNSQNKLYDTILLDTKNILFDSVMFTQEGITKHARELAKQLHSRKWNLFLTDRYRNGHDAVFREMYNAFDIEYDNYITFVNQPPIRPTSPSASLASNLTRQNLIYYLAWEGDMLPPVWAQVMDAPTIKKILTPSNYCKNVFMKSLNRNKDKVEVLPHGVNTKLYTMPEENRVRKIIKNDGLKAFLFVGTWDGSNKDRKGLDILMKAWKEISKELPDWKLVLKLNSIYFNSAHWSHSLRNFIGNARRIELIDTDLTDEQMADLYKDSNVFVMPTRAEGFCIPALEAKACGLPLIITGETGHMDFVNKDIDKLIKVLRKTEALNRYPYAGQDSNGNKWHVNWVEPSKVSLVELMKETANNMPKREQLLQESKRIAEKYSWEIVGDMFEKMCVETLKNN